MNTLFGYDGKTCVVTGASSGMGKATAELLVSLGANVYTLSRTHAGIAGTKGDIVCDLTAREQIDDAFAQMPDAIDSFFGVAGMLGAELPFMHVAKLNLLANKYICEEILPHRMVEGGSVAIVTSGVGLCWDRPGNIDFYRTVVDADGYDAAVAALEATGLTGINQGFAYVYTKLAANYLVARLQHILGPKRIRVNALMPGSTRTNFGKEGTVGNADTLSADDPFSGYSGRVADPVEMAWPLVFLNSKLASYVSGTYMFADHGFGSEVMAGIKANPVGESIAANFARGR